MKKVLSLLAAAGLIAAASTAFGASIVNSKHDLSVTSTSGGTKASAGTQICIYCHAPHNAAASIPIWNRTAPVAALNSFKLYSGVNMQNVSFSTGFTSDSTSLFCMSCHDGQTNLSAVHNAGALTGASYNSATARFINPAAGQFAAGTITNLKASWIGGTDLSKTHPINFPVADVNNSQSDLNLNAGVANMGPGVAAGITWTNGKTFPLFKSKDASRQVAGIGNDRFLECGSCHAVHDSAYSPFLRDTMDQSKLCLGCHNK